MNFLIETYKKAFLSGNTTIFWGNETHSRAWDETTLYIYFFIVFFTIYSTFQVEKSKKLQTLKAQVYQNAQTNISIWFFISLLALLFFMGFRGLWVGIDTMAYSISVEDATSIASVFNDGTTTEPLYKLLIVGLHYISPNRNVTIFIFSAIIIYFIGSTLKRYYMDLNFIIAVPTFVCLYYFQSFDLIRISIAASFLTWSFPLLQSEQYKKFSVRILIAVFVHYSSLVVYLPLGLLILYKRSKTATWFVCLGLVVILITAVNIFKDYVSLIDRYANYVSGNVESQFSWALLIDYMPCLYICYYIYKHHISGHWADLMVCFSMSVMIIRLLAFLVTAAGRLTIQFLTLTVILLPYWVNYIRKTDKSTSRILTPICLLWLLIRMHKYFISYLAADGIMPYNFFWNE